MRLDTHNSNVAATIGYYKDIMVKVGRGPEEVWRAGLANAARLRHRRRQRQQPEA